MNRSQLNVLYAAALCQRLPNYPNEELIFFIAAALDKAYDRGYEEALNKGWIIEQEKALTERGGELNTPYNCPHSPECFRDMTTKRFDCDPVIRDVR